MAKEQLRPGLVKMAQFAYSGHFIDWHACDRGSLGELQGKGGSSNRSRARTGDLVTVKMLVSCASSQYPAQGRNSELSSTMFSLEVEEEIARAASL